MIPDKEISVADAMRYRCEEMCEFDQPKVDGFTHHFFSDRKRSLQILAAHLDQEGYSIERIYKYPPLKNVLTALRVGDCNAPALRKRYARLERLCEGLGGVTFIGATPVISGAARKVENQAHGKQRKSSSRLIKES